jgi:aspartyl protease family protein
MKHAPILMVVAAGGLFGWFAPNLSADRRAPEEAAPVAASAPAAASTFGPDPGVVLRRAADGHFYAEVIVGASSTRMLVDTGASVVALTAEDADAIGIPWRSVPLEPVARGAGGEVLGVRVVLDRIQLGLHEAQGVEAVVVPQDLEVSLLGQSFLSHIARVEIDRDRMTLGT